LWDGLKEDNLQVVSTDHCPFCFEDQKILGKNDFTKFPTAVLELKIACSFCIITA